jgi:hypothetical protein
MSQATKLDRANWSKVQFGDGSPGVNTKGNIYIDQLASGSGLWVKGSTWTQVGGLSTTSPSYENGLAKFDSVDADNIETCLWRETVNTTGPSYSTILQATDAIDQTSGWDDIIQYNQFVSEGPVDFSVILGNTTARAVVMTSDSRYFYLYDDGGGPYKILNEGIDNSWTIYGGILKCDNDTDGVINLQTLGTYSAAVEVKVGSRHPTVGVVGNYCDLYITKDSTSSDIYIKTGSGNTDWTSLRFDGQTLYMAEFRDRKTTPGGASTATSYHTRDLNRTVFNDITGCSLDTVNARITLPVGEYYIEAHCPHYNSSGSESAHYVLLYNYTDSSEETWGQTAVCGDGNQNYAVVAGKLIVSGSSKQYEIRHWIQQAVASDGLGKEINEISGHPGSYDYYTWVRIVDLKA